MPLPSSRLVQVAFFKDPLRLPQEPPYVQPPGPPPPPDEPRADFVGAPLVGVIPFEVDFTDLSDNATSWAWNFGDGGTSTAQNPSHNFTVEGTYGVVLQITGPGGTDSKTRTAYVHANAVVGISATPNLTATRGVDYVPFTPTASGGVPPYAFSAVGDWPDGITVDLETGVVAGVPIENGSFPNLKVRVTDTTLATADTAAFTLVVAAAVGVSGSPVLTATYNRPYTGFDVNFTGGTAPVVFSKVGSWPSGLDLHTGTGVVSGTPTLAGTFAALSVRATDTYGSNAQLTAFTLTIANQVGITGTPVTVGEQDVPYAGFDCSHTGGTAPVVYALVGDWPDGITINSSTGTVSGTPTAGGVYTDLSVSATDAYGSTASLALFAIDVDDVPVAPPALEDFDAYQTDTTKWRNIPYGPATWTEPGGGTTLFQRIDIDLPAGTAPAGGWPVVMYFHPNGSTKFVTGGSTIDTARTEILAAGMAFVSVEFRHPVVNVSFGAPHEDAGLAIQFTRGLAEAFDFNEGAFGAISKSRGSLSLWQALQADMIDAGAPTWAGRQSSLLQAVWTHAAQTTYSTTEFANLFIVSGQRAGFLVANPDDARWKSSIQDIATAPSVPEIMILHKDAYPTGFVNANQVNEHYSGFGSAFRDAAIAAGHGAKVEAHDLIPEANSYIGAADWFADLLLIDTTSYGATEMLGANTGPTIEYTTRMWTNFNDQGRACWCPSGDNSGFGYTSVSLKSDGYPATGTTSTRVFAAVVTNWDAGDYLFECEGNLAGGGASITIVGTGTWHVAPSFNAGTNKTTATLRVPTGQDGSATISLRFNVVPSDFGLVKLMAPGYALNTTQKVRTEFKTHVAPFALLRFMDQGNTNGQDAAFAGGGNQDVNWSGSYAEGATVLKRPHSVAAAFEIGNECEAKFIWTNIPAKANNSYIDSYVADGAARRVGGSTWWIEFGNELWNGTLGESTAYNDIRTAAFTLASVRAGNDFASITRSGGNLVTAVFVEPHGQTIGTMSAYVKQEDDEFAAGTETITVVDADTVTWVDAGANGAIPLGQSPDNTYIFFDPTHTLCRQLTDYHFPEYPTAGYVRIRYMLQRARRIWEAVDALDETANIKVMLGTWMASTFNYVPCLAWAAEEYGDLSWLFAMPPAVYMEPATPNNLTTVTAVFTQLDANALITLGRALRWNNLMRTWGMQRIAYEWGPHTHDEGSGGTGGDQAARRANIVAAHSDDRMRERLKSWQHSWTNRGGQQMAFFHAGIAEQPTTPNATWPVTYGDYPDDATSAKYAAFTELFVESALSVEEAGVNNGVINYTDVLPNDTEFLGQGNGSGASWFLIRDTDAVQDIKIGVSFATPGTKTVKINACTNGGGTVAYTAYLDGASISTGNLPASTGSVFSTPPQQAFSVTVNVAEAGDHELTFHVPNASRADWVGLRLADVS